jgi:ribosome recycling factor
MEFNWKQFKKTTEEKMVKSVENIQNQMNTLRVGGASPTMLDRVFVDYYGSPTPLSQVARVATSGAQQLVVEPFDKTLLKEIEKAIATADLNLTPTNDGSGVIRINVSLDTGTFVALQSLSKYQAHVHLHIRPVGEKILLCLRFPL